MQIPPNDLGDPNSTERSNLVLAVSAIFTDIGGVEPGEAHSLLDRLSDVDWDDCAEQHGFPVASLMAVAIFMADAAAGVDAHAAAYIDILPTDPVMRTLFEEHAAGPLLKALASAHKIPLEFIETAMRRL
jgi:hypothetical protein